MVRWDGWREVRKVTISADSVIVMVFGESESVDPDGGGVYCRTGTRPRCS